MSQHDFVIADQTSASFRADLNLALQALASLSSGTGTPSTTYANMLWYETDTNLLKMRDEADAAWIQIGYLDQTSGEFRIIEGTEVSDLSGVMVAVLDTFSTTIWKNGTNTEARLISPDKLKAAILEHTPTALSVSGWHPYDMVTVGDGADGEIYDFAVDGALATVDTPNFADGYEYAIFFEGVSVTVGALLLQLYLTTTAAYLTIETLSMSPVRNYTGLYRFTYPRLATRGHSLVWDVDLIDDTGASLTSGTSTGINTTAQTTDSARITQASGTFDAGKIYMYRRREYVTG